METVPGTNTSDKNTETEEEIIDEKHLVEPSLTDQLANKFKFFFFNKYTDELTNMQLGLKISLLGNIFFAFLIYMLINSLINVADKKEINIEIVQGAKAGKYVVSNSWASESFHRMFAKSIILDASNYNFANIDEKTNFILSNTTPSTYDKTYADAKKNAEFIKSNRVVQEFDVREWKFTGSKNVTDGKYKTATITAIGFVTRIVSGITTHEKVPFEFSLDTKIIGGLPYLESYQQKFNGLVKKTAEERRKENEERRKERENN
ncbi:MAG: TraE/TraK family type IV conjugative transfer system protein [Halarcobacter sp.]